MERTANKPYNPEETPRPIQTLLGNREALKRFLGVDRVYYTPPSSTDHYVHLYPHDSYYAAMIYSHFGYTQEATDEIFSVLSRQDNRGFSPNQHFAPKGRSYDLERWWFKDRNKHSSYSHPPIAALATLKTVEALDNAGEPDRSQRFLDLTYPYLKPAYLYYHNHRRHSHEIPLVFNIHPHETGNDSEPITDFIRLRFARNGPETADWINWLNRRTDYLSTALVLGGLMSTLGWNEQRVRHLFEFYSPKFNAMMVDNELIMSGLAARLGKTEDEQYFRQSALDLEQAMKNYMWDPNGAGGIGAFYGLRGRSLQPIRTISVSNLYSSILPNISARQLQSQLDLYEVAGFDTDFPIPSTPPIDPHTLMSNPSFDPHNQERDRLRQGESWLDDNHYIIVRGLRRQAERRDIQDRPDLIKRAKYHDSKVTLKSKTMVSRGYFEHYNPLTGEPQRTNKVRDFAWSTLADVM